MNKSKHVTVVIPTYNRKSMLKETIESLFCQTYPKDLYEIIVVDDGSSDETHEMIKVLSRTAPVKFRYFNQIHKRQASARNLGIKNAKGEIVCFIDDDCIADTHWIEHLVAGYASEKVGGVGGMILGNSLKTLSEKYIESSGYLKHENHGYYLATANASYRKEILEKVGGFDLFFLNAEDVDISLRVLNEGHALIYSSNAICYHYHPSSIKSLLRKAYSRGIAYIRLTKKYDLEPSLVHITIWKFGVIIFNFTIAPIYRVSRISAKDDKIYFLLEPFIKGVTTAFYMVGLFKEACFGIPYEGKIIALKSEFILNEELNSFSTLLRKIKKNLTDKLSR